MEGRELEIKKEAAFLDPFQDRVSLSCNVAFQRPRRSHIPLWGIQIELVMPVGSSPGHWRPRGCIAVGFRVENSKSRRKRSHKLTSCCLQGQCSYRKSCLVAGSNCPASFTPRELTCDISSKSRKARGRLSKTKSKEYIEDWRVSCALSAMLYVSLARVKCYLGKGEGEGEQNSENPLPPKRRG